VNRNCNKLQLFGSTEIISTLQSDKTGVETKTFVMKLFASE